MVDVGTGTPALVAANGAGGVGVIGEAFAGTVSDGAAQPTPAEARPGPADNGGNSVSRPRLSLALSVLDSRRLSLRLSRNRSSHSSRSRLEVVARRTVDILVAGTALLVLSPLMIMIGVAIRLTSPGPAVLRQLRIGLGREPFPFYKFRTMRVSGDDTAHREMIARELRGEDTSNGGSWKLCDDNRITRFGGFLRRTSLDELPQLINVLRGDMTIVGPRPCLVWEAELFPGEFGERFAVRPGLTGLWQVSGRSTMGTLDMLRLDVTYVRQQTLRGDIAIMARTVPVLLRRDGAR
jgi:lipopolysaccharide/colanic/teichoic acid biosynthesis glycosyltransferase